MSRPTNYTPELGALICELMAEGDKSLKDICADESMPKVSTIGHWRAKHPEFAALYAHARELAGDAEADLAKRYSNTSHVWVDDENNPGERILVPVDVQRSKLMADTAKWRAAKLYAKNWGDRTALDISGSLNIAEAEDGELLARIEELLTRGILTLPAGVMLVERDTEEDDGFDLV